MERKTTVDPWVCRPCGAKFWAAIQYFRHFTRQHDGQVPCDGCGTFVSRDYRGLRHIRKCATHKCRTCDKVMSRHKIYAHLKKEHDRTGFLCPNGCSKFYRSFRIYRGLRDSHVCGQLGVVRRAHRRPQLHVQARDEATGGRRCVPAGTGRWAAAPCSGMPGSSGRC